MRVGETYNGYHVEQLLGNGSYGTVYRMTKDGDTFAVKAMSSKMKGVDTEMSLVGEKFRSPFLVKYRSAFETKVDEEPYTCIIMEYCSQGDLHKVMNKYSKEKSDGYNTPKLIKIFIQIVLALQELHEKDNVKVDIRKIENEVDVEELYHNLIKVIWPEVFGPMIGEKQASVLMEDYQSVQKVKEEMTNGVVYCFIESNSERIGYFAYELQEKQLYVVCVFLLFDKRGNGFTRKIFSSFEQIARENGKNKLHLRVNRGNKKAVAVYLHFGFEIVKEVETPLGEFFLSDYLMDKKLE